MQHCAGFISAESLHVSGVKCPSSRVLKNWHGGPWYRCYSCRQVITSPYQGRNKTCTLLHQVGVLFDPEMNVTKSTVYINMIMSFIQIAVAYNPLRNKTSSATTHCVFVRTVCLLTQLTDFLEICQRMYACIIIGQPDFVHYICSCICSLFDNAPSSSEYATLNNWMIRKT